MKQARGQGLTNKKCNGCLTSALDTFNLGSPVSTGMVCSLDVDQQLLCKMLSNLPMILGTSNKQKLDY